MCIRDSHYAIREKEPVSLAEKDIILETLRNKYDLAIAEPITLNQMKLIYYPMTTGRNETGHWMCDMIPAWQFRFIEDEICLLYTSGKNFQMNIAALCIQENPKVPEPKQKLMRHRG